MLFFDRSRVSEQFSLYKEYQNYLSEKEYYENEIHECNAKIKLLEESQDYIEKIGREKYFLKRDNEVIYYFEKE
jgi:cell division protein FtsB